MSMVNHAHSEESMGHRKRRSTPLHDDDKEKMDRLVCENKKLKASVLQLEAQQKELKAAQDANIRCYVCQEAMKCPVIVCPDLNHAACAVCVASQVKFEHLKYDVRFGEDSMPYVVTDWVQSVNAFKCGACKQMALLKYPGALLFNLIDPHCERTCEFCDKEFNLDALGLHIVTCDAQLTECPLCNETDIKIRDMDHHVKTSCRKVICKCCNMIGTFAAIQQHTQDMLLLSDMKECMHTLVDRILRKDDASFPKLANAFLGLLQAADQRFPTTSGRATPADDGPNTIYNIAERFSQDERTAQEVLHGSRGGAQMSTEARRLRFNNIETQRRNALRSVVDFTRNTILADDAGDDDDDVISEGPPPLRLATENDS